MTAAKTDEPSVRALAPDDLAAVTAIDKTVTGRSRKGYFEKRLAAALREPKAHIQLAIDGEAGVAGPRLAGYVLARIRAGEYGRDEPSVVLEVINVDPAAHRRGLGRRLLAGLEDAMRRRGIRRLETEVSWKLHEMMRFVDAAGFSLAPRQILQREVGTLGADL